MAGAIALRTDYTASALRGLASRMRDANVARRLLSLAAVRDGASRGEAARIGGMDRQTLRDWVHRFNAAGPDGLRDQWRNGSIFSGSSKSVLASPITNAMSPPC